MQHNCAVIQFGFFRMDLLHWSETCYGYAARVAGKKWVSAKKMIWEKMCFTLRINTVILMQIYGYYEKTKENVICTLNAGT